MPEVISTQPQSQAKPSARVPKVSLNSDGQRHPALNAVALFTFLAGIAAFALGLVVQAHMAATILGLAAFGVGMVGQLLSATREQRILIIAGIIAGAVGAGLGIAHGGFG
jgi:uncharacterized membrane protein